MAMGGIACVVMDIQRNFGKKERVVLETIESSNNGHHIKMEVTGVKDRCFFTNIAKNIKKHFIKEKREVIRTYKSSNNGYSIKVEETGVKHSFWIH